MSDFIPDWLKDAKPRGSTAPLPTEAPLGVSAPVMEQAEQNIQSFLESATPRQEIQFPTEEFVPPPKPERTDITEMTSEQIDETLGSTDLYLEEQSRAQAAEILTMQLGISSEEAYDSAHELVREWTGEYMELGKFVEHIGDGWKGGWASLQRGLIGYEMLINGITDEHLENLSAWEGTMPDPEKLRFAVPWKQIVEMFELDPLTATWDTVKNIPGYAQRLSAEVLRATAQLAPIMLKTMSEGAKRGAAMATIAGTMGVPLLTTPGIGQVGYTLTVGGAYAVGQLSGTMETIGKLEAGLIFADLMTMKDDTGNRIDPGLAKTVAWTVGAINAGLEVWGLQHVPGVNRLFRIAARKATQRIVQKKLLQGIVKRNLKQFGVDYGWEIVTEVLQEVTSAIGVEIGKDWDEAAARDAYLRWREVKRSLNIGEGWPAERIGQEPDDEKLFEENLAKYPDYWNQIPMIAAETAKEVAMGMALLQITGAGGRITQEYFTEKGMRKLQARAKEYAQEMKQEGMTNRIAEKYKQQIEDPPKDEDELSERMKRAVPVVQTKEEVKPAAPVEPVEGAALEVTPKLTRLQFQESIKKSWGFSDVEADTAMRVLEAEAKAEGISVDEFVEQAIAEVREGELPEDALYSTEGYHGSGADFEKFDSHYIRTGEGHLSFGSGHYVTNRQDIARGYATRMGESEIVELSIGNIAVYRQGSPINYSMPKGTGFYGEARAIIQEQILIYEKDLWAGYDRMGEEGVLLSIQNIFDGMIENYKADIKSDEGTIAELQKVTGVSGTPALIAQAQGNISHNQEMIKRWEKWRPDTLDHMNLEMKPGRFLYKVKVTGPDEDVNWIKYYEPIEADQWEMIENQAQKEGLPMDRFGRPLSDDAWQQMLVDSVRQSRTFKAVIREAAASFPDPIAIPTEAQIAKGKTGQDLQSYWINASNKIHADVRDRLNKLWQLDTKYKQEIKRTTDPDLKRDLQERHKTIKNNLEMAREHYDNVTRETWIWHNWQSRLAQASRRKERTNTGGGFYDETYVREGWTMDQMAKFLKRAGFTGIKYPSQSLATGNQDYEKGTNYVVFADEDLEIEEQTLFSEQEGRTRAAVQFMEDGRAIIHATEQANFADFVHEMSHIFRRRIFARINEADYDDLIRWAGAEEGWTRGAEEKFVDGFMQYALEGRVPSLSIKRIFDSFIKWLQDTIDALGGAADVLTDRVRNIFDNLYTLPEQEVTVSEKPLSETEAGPDVDALIELGFDDFLEAEEKNEAAQKVDERMEVLSNIRLWREQIKGLDSQIEQTKQIQNRREKKTTRDGLQEHKIYLERRINEESRVLVDRVGKFTDAELTHQNMEYRLQTLGAKSWKGRGYSPIVSTTIYMATRKGGITEKQYNAIKKAWNANPDMWRLEFMLYDANVDPESVAEFMLAAGMESDITTDLKNELDAWEMLQKDQLLANKWKNQAIRTGAGQEEVKPNYKSLRAILAEGLRSPRQRTDMLSGVTKIDNLVKEYHALRAGMKGQERAARTAFRQGKRETAEAYKARMKKERLLRAEALRQTRQKKRERDYVLKLAKRIDKPVGKSIDFYYREAIEAIQAHIDPGFRTRKTLYAREMTREFLEKYPEAAGTMPAKILAKLEQRELNQLMIKELEEIDEEIAKLRKQGRLKQRLKDQAQALVFANKKKKVINSILGGKEIIPPKGKGKATRTSKWKEKLQAWDAGILRPQRIFDLLDGGLEFKGPVFDFFYNQAQDLTDVEMRGTDKRTDVGRAKLKDLGLTHRDLGAKRTIEGVTYQVDEIMDLYVGFKNALKRTAIIWGNNLDSELAEQFIDTLTDKEKAWADWIVEEYEAHYDSLRQAHIAFKNEDLGHEVFYTPIVRMDLDYEEFSENLAQELVMRQGLYRAAASRGFTINRMNIAPEHQKEIRLGLTSTWFSQVSKQEHYIHGAQIIKDLDKMAHDSEFTAAVREVAGREYVKVIQSWVGRVARPEIYRSSYDMSKWNKAAKILRRHLAIAHLAGNISSMMRQLPSVFFYLPDAGISWVTASSMKFLGNPFEMINLVKEKSVQMKHRSIEREIEELKRADRSTYDKILKKVGEVGMVGIYAFDRIAITIGWNAVYQKVLKDTGNEATAVREADNTTLRTQPAAHAKDIAQLYATSEWLNWFTMFTNQLNQIYGMVRHDIPQDVKHKRVKSAMYGMMGMAISAGIIWSIAHRRLPKRPEDMLDALVDQTAAIIPLFGKEILAVKDGWTTGPPSAIKSLVDIPITAEQIISGRFREKDLNRAIRSAAELLGIPYTGPKRAARFLESGRPLELIGGKPRK